ncbi:MAG: DUF1501 domain-containing protein [Planctomycetes bacterium]|nr:DUF1501 domain-containing protein [Planctomycetota bacterium]
MLTIFGARHSYCDHLSRRDFLRIGGLGATGLGMADMLRLRALGAADGAKPRAVIMICLPGGPSHHDMYDMKPDAAAEVRGEFRPAPTNVPGMQFCDLMPAQAKIADKLAIVRSMRFIQPDHQLHEVFSGFPLAQRRPAFGSVVSRLLPDRPTKLPRYMSLGMNDHPRTVARAEMAMYAGEAHAPFAPVGAGRSALALSDDVPLSRLDGRTSLRDQFDALRREAERQNDQVAAFDAHRAQAIELMTTSLVRDALDTSREPAHIRALYGADVTMKHNYQFGGTWHGTNFLIARRLVEAGVPVVTISEGGWDHHGNVADVRGTIFERSREQLPAYDRSIAALVTDLHQRGLDRDVAVVVWGEFGRTPVVNKNGGRDHWLSAGFAMFACGGFKTGQMIGATDSLGAAPTTRAYTPPNVLATLYRHLGIDPHAKLTDHTGRPMGLVDDAEAIGELV